MRNRLDTGSCYRSSCPSEGEQVPEPTALCCSRTVITKSLGCLRCYFLRGTMVHCCCSQGSVVLSLLMACCCWPKACLWSLFVKKHVSTIHGQLKVESRRPLFFPSHTFLHGSNLDRDMAEWTQVLLVTFQSHPLWGTLTPPGSSRSKPSPPQRAPL